MRTTLYTILLLASSLAVEAQNKYFNKRFDSELLNDIGYNCFAKDGRIIVLSGAQNNQYQGLYYWELDSVGDLVKTDTLIRDTAVFYAFGYNGGTALAGNNFFLSPMTTVKYGPYRSAAGFMKLNTNGDTLFTRRLKDTQTEKSYIWVCDTAEHGNLLFGGWVHLNSEYYQDNSALLIKTDSLGNTIWEKRFRHLGSFSDIGSVKYVNGRGYLVMSTDWTPRVHFYNGHPQYYWNPGIWVMLLDTAGNLLRERNEYTDSTIGGLYLDGNGGYMGFGYIDSVFKYGIHDYRSFPSYLVHIDTNFNTTWVMGLVDSLTEYDPVKMIQTKDNGYLYAGYIYTRYTAATYGWALKLDKNKQVLWEHYYYSDSLYNCQIMDVKEKDNGDLLFCGFTRGQQGTPGNLGTDMWVVTTDSMGCPAGDCLWPTDIDDPQWPPHQNAEVLLLYPNPGRDRFRFESGQRGIGQMIGTEGRRRLVFDVHAGLNTVQVPLSFAPGIYFIQINYDNGKKALAKWVKE